MKYLINDGPVQHLDNKVFPSFSIIHNETVYQIAATNWVVYASDKDDAVSNLMIALEVLLPDDAEIESDYIDELPVIIPESITEHDVDVWVNSSPQKGRYGGLMPTAIATLTGHAQQAAQMVADEQLPVRDYRRDLVLECKVSMYIHDDKVKQSLIDVIPELDIDLPENLSDAEKETIADSMIKWVDKEEKYYIEDHALESGRDYATYIAEDIGTSIKGYTGRSGGHMVLDLPTNAEEWDFTEIMQYAVMAWEVESYTQAGGYEHDFAWAAMRAFENEKECRDTMTAIMSARIGHDLSGLTIC